MTVGDSVIVCVCVCVGGEEREIRDGLKGKL